MMSHEEEEEDVAGLLAEEGRGPKGRPSGGGGGLFGLCACFSVEYYQPYFDVNTDEVAARIKYALVSFGGSGSPFLEVVREKPDAYGPWWISTTLIFLISVTSHLKSLFSAEAGTKYDFTNVTFAAMTVYSYVGVTALAMWVALNYWLKTPLTLLQCACVVGYSLCVYCLASILCVLPYLSWIVLLAACALSSLFVAKSTLPVIEHQEKQQVVAFIGTLVVINVALMLVIKLGLY